MWDLFAQVVPSPWLGEGALAGLASFLLAAWLNEWVVSGKLYRQNRADFQKRLDDEVAQRTREVAAAQKEIEYWRELALASLGHAEEAVKLAEARRAIP